MNIAVVVLLSAPYLIFVCAGFAWLLTRFRRSYAIVPRNRLVTAQLSEGKQLHILTIGRTEAEIRETAPLVNELLGRRNVA